MMLEAAPTPCSRTGFHIINNSLWAASVSTQAEVGAVTPAHEVPPAAGADGGKPGPTMIKSPGAAASIALWTEPGPRAWGGASPPTATVTGPRACLPAPATLG